MQKNTIRQLQDVDNGQKIVSMEITKFMAFHISDTLMLMQMELDVRQNLGKLARCQMSNKYNSAEHISILAELLTLQDMVNETQIKIISAKKKLDKMNELKKAEDEIPF